MIPSENAVPNTLTGNDLGRGPREVPSDIVKMAGNMAHERTKISSGVTVVKGGQNKDAFNKMSTDATEGFKSGNITKYNEKGIKEWEDKSPPKRKTVEIDSSK